MDLRMKSGGVGDKAGGRDRQTDLLRKETPLIITSLRIILIIQFWKKTDFGNLFLFICTYMYI